MEQSTALDLLDDYVKTLNEKYTLIDKINISIFDFPSYALPEVEGEKDSLSPESTVVDIASEKSSSFARGLTCKTCSKAFACRQEQIEHFKSRLHSINLKRSLLKLPLLASETDLDSNMAGKESDFTYDEDIEEEEEEEEEKEEEFREEDDPEDIIDELEAEVDTNPMEEYASYKQNENSPLISSKGAVGKQFSATSGPELIYHPKQSKWQVVVSVASMLKIDDDCEDQWRVSAEDDPWKTLHFTLYKAVSNTLWCVMLLRSGKFAITIFERNTPILHRVKKHYTVRAKAGGSQSNYDSKGSNAKSMGANLRRRGEAKLKEDIKNVLSEWRSQIQSCCLLLTSIPKTMKSHIFLDEDGKETYLYRTDPRLRSIPFITDKPSFEETKRVHRICSTISLTRYIEDVSTSTVVEDTSKSLQSTERDTEEVVGGTQKSTSPSLSSQSALKFDVLPETIALCEACTVGDDEKVLSILGKLGSDGMLSSVNFPHDMEDLKTALHIASERGYAQIVKDLLMNGADPTRPDHRSRTPYAVAKDKDVRDVFRRCRGYDGMEEKWNWDSCGVPAAITEEIEKAQKEREKEKKKRAKQKKKETKEKDAQEALELKRREEQEQILAEQRKLEKIKSAGECAACKISLYGKKVFDVFDRRCCSGPCVIKYRRQLSAEAAEKRFSGGQK